MKRGRALKKTRGEQELCRQKEREIAKYDKLVCLRIYIYICTHLYRLDQEIAELKVTVNRQKQQILQYAVYQKFMLSLLQHSPEVCEKNACSSPDHYIYYSLMRLEKSSQDMMH